MAIISAEQGWVARYSAATTNMEIQVVAWKITEDWFTATGLVPDPADPTMIVQAPQAKVPNGYTFAGYFFRKKPQA